jgi:hypothetical protein
MIFGHCALRVKNLNTESTENFTEYTEFFIVQNIILSVLNKIDF